MSQSSTNYMSADTYMLLLTEMQVCFVHIVLLIPKKIIILSCTERKWVPTYWLKLQEIPGAPR